MISNDGSLLTSVISFSVSVTLVNLLPSSLCDQKCQVLPCIREFANKEVATTGAKSDNPHNTYSD